MLKRDSAVWSVDLWGPGKHAYDTIRYDTIRDASFNVRLKADISQLNLQHGTDNLKGENRKT